MNTKYQSGSIVTVDSAIGHIERVVVEDTGDLVHVCRQEEYDAAKSQLRQPVTSAFRKADIVK